MPGNLQSIPLSVIASWPKPNYIDPVQRTWMPIYAGVLQGVMTALVATRLWLRAMNQAGSLGLDDALLIPAFLAATMNTALTILSCEKYGMDRHTWDVPPTTFPNTALMAWLCELAFLVATCCTKISVLLFYRRLVGGTYSKKWLYATYAAIVFTALYTLAFILALVFNCQPTEAYWKAYSVTYTKEWHCTDTRSLNPLSGVLSVVSDAYSVLLPMGMLRHFDIPKKKKMALNAVFALGFLVVGAGIARTYYITRLGESFDITWVGYNVFIWADLELQLAIICASAPALRVLFRKYLSDPISRAVGSASSRSRSGIRSTNRDSKQMDDVVNNYSYKNEDRDLDAKGDKTLVKHSVKRSIETMGDLESSWSSTAPSEPYLVKSAADYETYALQNLEKSRSQARRYTLRRSEDNREMRPTYQEPFHPQHVPTTWLDTENESSREDLYQYNAR